MNEVNDNKISPFHFKILMNNRLIKILSFSLSNNTYELSFDWVIHLEYTRVYKK